MNPLFSFLRPLIFKLDPEVAHEFVRHSARFVSPSLASLVRKQVLSGLAIKPFQLKNIKPHFEHSLGLAAGFDKNAEMLWLMYALGFGFVELGTVTPKPQEGNPKPRIFRLAEQQSLVNRLGFNNVGLKEFVKNFKRFDRPPFPIGINMGKNKNTPNEQALEDYCKCAEELSSLADYLVINLSSPNTPGLRALLDWDFIQKIEQYCVKKYAPLPVFLKIPSFKDMPQLQELLGPLFESQFAGIIACNTTVQREAIGLQPSTPEGGVSGTLLKPLALQTVQTICDFRKTRESFSGKLVIGVGGIMSAPDLAQMKNTTCDLQQIYTGLIYGGPQIISKLLANPQ